MKNLITLAVFLVLISSCTKQAETLNLPPEDSMSLDFSSFTETKSATITDETMLNKTYAGLNIAFWNTVIFVNLAVPVTSFRNAFNHIPVKVGDKIWEWSYAVEGWSGTYLARLTGEIKSDSVEWKMYITKTGTDPFTDLMWYSGKSASDRSGGYWVLNRNHKFPEKMLRIDWKSENNEVGDIQFTIVRELNDYGEPEKNLGAYIHYGLIEDYFDAYYDIHLYNDQASGFIDINIEWNREKKDGRVKSPNFYKNDYWHCWNSNGFDTTCN